ncbi:MAG: PQQ-binding-like beta-propeller repeat protein [Mariniblastus sp.]|nr:PQQ-binding-like beta-propeller repeat protein [Mariniblastus sp.]
MHKTKNGPTPSPATGCRMKRSINLLALCLSFIPLSNSTAEDWLRFRGPNGSGISVSQEKTATTFGDNENLVWKTRLPGPGASSPVVVGDRVFVTCYSGYGETRDDVGQMEDLKRHVVCIDRQNGKLLWQQDVDPYLPEDQYKGMGVPEHGYASSTPVSDGRHLYVFFGKSGVLAYDLDGNEVWKKNLGTKSNEREWGSAASPILFDDILIINASDEARAFYGLEASSGKEVWKTESRSLTNVWNTPIIVDGKTDPQLVISVPNEIRAFNPANGKLKWYSTKGVNAPSVSTSLVTDGDLVIAMGGRSLDAVAVKTGGHSDVTDNHVVWEGRGIAAIITPVSYQGHLYAIHRGIAHCLDAATGQPAYRERISPGAGRSASRPQETRPGDKPVRIPPPGQRRLRGSGNYSSPVIADGKIYQFTRDGTCYVLAAQPTYELLATNRFEADPSDFNATPAISDGQMFIRSNHFLYCIGSDKE